MKYFASLLLTLLVSCSSFRTAGTADYDNDGVISDVEYERFNKQLKEDAYKITQESLERRSNIIE